MDRTKYLPPDLAIRIAWALTSQMSENKEVRLEANRAKQLLLDIKEKAENNEKETRYVSLVCSAIEAAFRDLVIIINGRNLNFNDVKKLRDRQIENIQYYSQFSANLQSLIPRLSGMTVGSVGVSVLLTETVGEYLPALQEYALPLLLAIGAAIGYFLHGLVVVPIVRRMKMRENIKMDYERNLYYLQYVERSKKTLIALYHGVDRYHRTVFGGIYDPKASSKTIVEEMLGGVEPTMCSYVTDHMRTRVITPNLWSMCETGIESEIKKCPHWKH